MPYTTYSTTHSYDRNYGAWNSSYEWHSKKEGNGGNTLNRPAFAMPKDSDGNILPAVRVHNYVRSSTRTEKYYNFPHAGWGGENLVQAGGTFKYSDQDGGENNTLYITGMTLSVGKGGYTNRYMNSAGEIRVDQGRLPNPPPFSYYQVQNIEYTTGGYSTTDAEGAEQNNTYRLKGLPVWELTSVTNQQSIGNRIVEATSWVTQSSFDIEKTRTQITIRNTTNDTELFTIGRHRMAGETRDYTSEVTLLTRSGNTISRYSLFTMGGFDTTVKAILNYPYNYSDTDGNPIKDTIYYWTKTTANSASLYAWYSTDDVPDEFEVIDETYKETTKMFAQTYANNQFITNSFDRSSWRGSYVIAKADDEDIEFQAVGNGIRYARKSDGDTTTPTAKYNIKYTGNMRSTQENSHVSRTFKFPKGAQTMRDVYKGYVATDGKSMSDGYFLRELISTKDTITIQSSTLVDKVQPWHTSLYALKPHGDTQEQGEWRRSSDGAGVSLVVGQEDTIVKQEEIIILGMGLGTDTENFTIEGLTETRSFHEQEGREVLPMWEKVSPTTATAEREEIGFGVLRREAEVFASTGRRFKSADIISYTEDGVEKTYKKYTATEVYTRQDDAEMATVGWSTEDDPENGFQATYLTDDPERYYRRIRVTRGVTGRDATQGLIEFGDTAIRQKFVESTTKWVVAPYDIWGFKGGGSNNVEGNAGGGGYRSGSTAVAGVDGGGGYTTYSAETYVTGYGNNMKSRVETVWRKSAVGFQFIGAGTIEIPFLQIITGKTGYDGFVSGEDKNKTGKRGVYNSANTGAGATYSKQYDYIHLEAQDFKPYKGALNISTQVMNTQGSMAALKGQRFITSTEVTDTLETYYVPWTKTIEHDADGWMSWCASDYPYEIVELNTDELGQGCWEIWYKDECGNSKNDFLSPPDMGGGGNPTDMWYYGADGVLYDENGMPADPDDPQFNQPAREDSCGDYTWTFISTSHNPEDHTIEVKSTQQVIEPRGGFDLIPEYRFAQTYYGNMCLNDMRQTTGDVNIAHVNWWNPVPDTDAKWHFAHFDEIQFGFNLRNHSATALFGGGERTYEWFNNNPYDTNPSPLNWLAVRTHGEVFRSQLLGSFTYNAGSPNRELAPKYNNETFDAFLINHPENKHFFVDPRRNVNKLNPWELEDKTFQVGAFAKRGTTQSNSKSWADAMIFSSEILAGNFKTNSSFYKKYLENTHYSFGDAYEENENGDLELKYGVKAYTSSKREVKTLISGLDGVWRAEYGTMQSGSSSIDGASFDYATAKTYLYGTFIACPNSPLFEHPDKSTIPRITPCYTYNDDDSQSWVNGQFLKTGFNQSNIHGQYRRARASYIADENMSIGLQPIATYFDMNCNILNSDMPMRWSSREMWDATWSTGEEDISILAVPRFHHAFSWSVPNMLLIHRDKWIGYLQEDQDKFSIQGFMSIRYATLFDDYAPIGAMVNKKDPWLNHHNVWNNNAEYVRGDIRAIEQQEEGEDNSIDGNIFLNLLEERNSRLQDPNNYAVLINNTIKVAPIYP